MSNADYYEKIAHLYDLMYNETTGFDRMAQAQWVDEWREKCGLPKIVLDVACGTGRHLTCFESLGYSCFGIDASQTMLNIAAQHLDRTTLLKGYFHTFQLPAPVPLITCFFNALSYNTNLTELRLAFENIYQHLLYHGLFIFELFCGDTPQNVFDVKTYEANGLKFSRTFIGIPTEAGFRSTMVYVIFNGDTSEIIEETTLRGIFSEADIRRTLAECGFTILHTRSSHAPGASIFVAKK